MWNQGAGRFLLRQPGWENGSALERYNAMHALETRAGGPFGGSVLAEAGMSQENGVTRGGYHRGIFSDVEGFQRAPLALGMCSPPRGTTIEEELANTRRSQGLQDISMLRGIDKVHMFDNYLEVRDHRSEREGGFFNHNVDGLIYRHSSRKGSKDGSWDQEYAHSKYDEYSWDREGDKKDHRNCRWNSRKRDTEPGRMKDGDESPERGRHRDRSRSYSDKHRSRKTRSCSRSRSGSYASDEREGGYGEILYEPQKGKQGTRDVKRKREQPSASSVPSATLVVRGLSRRTVENDLSCAVAEWGPLMHVRVIKEKNSGISRGFAFLDFPSVEAAQKLMETIGDNGLMVDGRRIFFDYSSKPTGGLGGPQAPTDSKPGCIPGASKGSAASAVDWTCTLCDCVNFARRISCFQCNEGRTDATSVPLGKDCSTVPTHVLVVRGLEETVDEGSLRLEFSKCSSIKELRLIRDKITNVSRGFAFIHFHSVEEATKALESCKGKLLQKHGKPLRVDYAKNIQGTCPSSANAGNNLAGIAIEAAAFAQQYDASGWAPKEYNPDNENVGEKQKFPSATYESSVTAPQAGFVWDEASGYYYDAVSQFYYDGHHGLYYDGNNGVWYSYNQTTQQYESYVEQAGDIKTTQTRAADGHQTDSHHANLTKKAKDNTMKQKAVISAPPATIHVAQHAAEKKQCVSKREERWAPSESVMFGSKKKISGVMASRKQRQQGSPAAPVDQSVLETPTPSVAEEKPTSFLLNIITPERTSAAASVANVKKIQGVIHTRQRFGTVDESKKKNLSTERSNKLRAGSGVAVLTKKVEGIIHSKEGSSHTIQGQGAENHVGSGHHQSSEYTMGLSTANGTILPEEGSGVAVLTKKVEGIIHLKEGSRQRILGQGAQNLLGSDRCPLEYTQGVQLSTNSSTLSKEVAETVTTLGALTKLPSAIMPFKTNASALSSYGPAVAGGRRRFTETPLL